MLMSERKDQELLQRHSMLQALRPQEAEGLRSSPPPRSFRSLTLGSELEGEGDSHPWSYSTPSYPSWTNSCLLPSALALFLCWERRRTPCILCFRSLIWLLKIQT